MDQTKIFAPLFALVTLTFVVLLHIPIARFRAAVARRVVADDFRYGESARVPAEVTIPNRNYMNLLELPLLFYVLVLALYVTRQVDQVQCVLAWSYVLLRAGHSLVHLTYNHVIHRLLLFAFSNFVLSALWIRFAIALW